MNYQTWRDDFLLREAACAPSREPAEPTIDVLEKLAERLIGSCDEDEKFVPSDPELCAAYYTRHGWTVEDSEDGPVIALESFRQMHLDAIKAERRLEAEKAARKIAVEAHKVAVDANGIAVSEVKRHAAETRKWERRFYGAMAVLLFGGIAWLIGRGM
jgi:hypothetical protein